MKKIIFLVIIIAVSCNKNDKIKPIVKDIDELVFASGQIEWDDYYNLTAQTDGILQKADFEIGDEFNKNDILAIIDNKSSEVNLETTKEQLSITNQNITSSSPALLQLSYTINQAEDKYQQDKLMAERYSRLYKSQSISKLEYENMVINQSNSLSILNSLKKQYKLIEQQAIQSNINSKGQVKNNEVIKNYNQILVIKSGTIIKKHKNNGDFVRRGEIIATIANKNKVEIILNVDENSIDKVKLGQKVFVKFNTNKEKIHEGKISQILSAFEEQSQSFICKVILDNTLANSIYGTQLEANILISEKKNTLLIPRNYMGYGNKVNVEGKDENVIIKTGIISTDYIEVIEGIDRNTVLLPLKP